jgi:hypothetical protein
MESTWLAPRFALVTCTQKLPDRFVFTASLPVEARANDPLILITLEIKQPWRADSRLVSTITDVLSQRYPTIRRSTNPLQSFELSLKNINEELMGLAEAGETEWIGRLNGVIALIIGNEVHVAQTGQATAYLFRQQKISQILERQDITDPHPLTTFANIISGYTNAGDRLVLGNDDLFTLIPLESIRAAVSDETPWQAVQALARSLKRTRVLSVAAAVLGVEQAKTWEDVGDEPIVVNLEEYTQTWTKKLWKTLKPMLISGHQSATAALKKTRAAAANGTEKWRTAVVPKARNLWQSKVKKPRRQTTVATPERTRAVVQPVRTTRVNDLLASGETAVTLSVAGPIARAAQPVAAWLQRLDNRVNQIHLPLQRWSTGRYSRWLLVAAAVLLIGVTVYSAGLRRASVATASQLASNEQQLTIASDELAKVNSSIRLKEKDEANGRLATAQLALAAVASPSADQQTRLDDLSAQLAAAADTLNQVTRLTPQHEYPTIESGQLLSVNESLFVTASAGPEQSLLSRQSGTATPITTDPTITALTYDSDRAAFVALLANGNVSSLPAAGGSFAPITIAEGTAPLGKIKSFGRNLYIMDGASGTLWKMAASAAGYAKASTLVTDTTLANARDLAIDGAIFVLLADNTVAKYTRGKLDATFTLKETPAGVTFDQIFTDAQAEQLYLVDLKAGRISTYNKDGQYVQQYALNVVDLKQIVVDASAKRAYALSGAQILEYGL